MHWKSTTAPSTRPIASLIPGDRANDAQHHPAARRHYRAALDTAAWLPSISVMSYYDPYSSHYYDSAPQDLSFAEQPDSDYVEMVRDPQTGHYVRQDEQLSYKERQARAFQTLEGAIAWNDAHHPGWEKDAFIVPAGSTQPQPFRRPRSAPRSTSEWEWKQRRKLARIMLIAACIILPATLIVDLLIHLVGLIAFGAVMFIFCMLVVLMSKIDGETARGIGEVARVAVPAAASEYVRYRMARHVATGIVRDGVREAMKD
jgi:hypothetical protein